MDYWWTICHIELRKVEKRESNNLPLIDSWFVEEVGFRYLWLQSLNSLLHWKWMAVRCGEQPA